MCHMRASPFVGETPQYFPEDICPKLNVTERLEFELAYYDFAVQHINHNATGNPKKKKEI